MQPDESPFEESLECQRGFPPVVVCIPDYETGKYEEEIDGHVSVVEMLVQGACSETFEDMVAYHQQGSDTTESVQKFIMGFRIRKCGGWDVVHDIRFLINYRLILYAFLIPRKSNRRAKIITFA